MRLLIFLLFCLINLAGCAYYGDMHSSSEPLTTDTLTNHHTYRPSTTQIENTKNDWWKVFKDPELNQLIDVALADSPTMKIAESRVRKAQQFANKAYSSLWPSLDFSGYVQRQRFAEFGLVPPPFNGRTFNISDLGFNFNYEFDFWGKNRSILAARVSEECATQADLAQAQLILSAAIANTYFQLLNNIEQEKIAREDAHASQEITNIVVDRAKNGIESDIPVKNALAHEQSAKLAVQQFKQAQMLSRNQLAFLLGKNPFTTEIINRPFKYRAHSIHLPENLPAHLLIQRPDLFAAKARATAAAKQINVAKAYFFPDINLNGLFSYQTAAGHLFDPGSQNNAGTLAFDLPVFDAGARRANLGIKYAEYDVAINSYNQTLLRALREVADQLSIIQTVKQQILSQNNAVTAVRTNYKLFNSRYKHGIVNYEVVLETKELLLEYHAEQIQLQTRHLQAMVDMMKALGGNDSKQG